jgi:hypothetical protein
MHYYLYEIRNIINGKIYVGVHKTKVLDDGYMGSGKVIKRAIEKYGVDNFTKTILETFETQEEMFTREKEVVNEEFLCREDTYNLRRGGNGGWDYINKNNLQCSEEIRLSQIESGKQSQEKMKISGKHAFLNKEIRAKLINYMKLNKIGFMDPEVQKRGILAMASETSNSKRKETFKRNNHQSGEKNSQFGSMWITNGKESKPIKKTDLIPEGWYKGRTIKSICPVISVIE